MRRGVAVPVPVHAVHQPVVASGSARVDIGILERHLAEEEEEAGQHHGYDDSSCFKSRHIQQTLSSYDTFSEFRNMLAAVECL